MSQETLYIEMSHLRLWPP